MIEVGVFNELNVLRLTPPGAYLGNDVNDDVVLLPNKYIPENLAVGDRINVFIYRDSEDRLIATTLEPKIKLYEVAGLEVIDVNNTGAFLDMGLEKDLMVPFKEQYRKMNVGEAYLVYLYVDEDSNRLVATSKIDRFLDMEDIDFSVGDKVDIWVGDKTELGINVVINGKFRGLIYHNEIFKKIYRGTKEVGYIKAIREDGKIDVALQPQGEQNIEPTAKIILEYLEANKGYINLNDNSDPDTIKHKLQMSKKTFKKAIGTLFKQRLISIEEDGIRLL